MHCKVRRALLTQHCQAGHNLERVCALRVGDSWTDDMALVADWQAAARAPVLSWALTMWPPEQPRCSCYEQCVPNTRSRQVCMARLKPTMQLSTQLPQCAACRTGLQHPPHSCPCLSI